MKSKNRGSLSGILLAVALGAANSGCGGGNTGGGGGLVAASVSATIAVGTAPRAIAVG